MLKPKNKGKISKADRKTTRHTGELLTYQKQQMPKRKWEDIFKAMKGEGGGGECSAQNSHPVKSFFKAESERKPSPDEGEHTCTTRNTF